jgi:hypothetical protein
MKKDEHGNFFPGDPGPEPKGKPTAEEQDKQAASALSAPPPAAAPAPEPEDLATEAFAEMDRLDEQAIVAGVQGREIATLLYNLPFKFDYGRKDCGVQGCKYQREGTPHVHVVGVSAQGMNEIARIYGGISRKIISCSRIHHNGKYYWQAKAVAEDILNGGSAEAEVMQPDEMKRGAGGDMRSLFPQIIAQTKAERNAMRKLLPQFLLKGLAEMAQRGDKTFSEVAAKRLVSSLGGEARQNMILALMKAKVIAQVNQSILPAPKMEQPALPEAQNTESGSRP